MIRDRSRPKLGRDATIGELLKKKVDEGVTVYVLLWLDPIGFGGTNGKEVVRYFAGSKVQCAAVPRLANGSIAWDVLVNFEQSWRRLDKNVSYPLRDLQDIVIPPSPVTSPDDPETWNVQCFRSIFGADIDGFPTTPEEAEKVGLLLKKKNIIERGIQDAYINAIRHAGALHLIPKELSLKIISKIEVGERFSVYIVVLMFPEGIPDSTSIQAMLDWQRRTMEMMYKDVTEAIKAKGIKEDPQNYLTFFVLSFKEDLPGQLLPYSIKITNDGTIQELPGFEFFPDTQARVLGNYTITIPAIITT
ncbi:hypothetical protein RJT34_05698 [Clitoria ternatea]|uniref:Phospholipase D C-terminal domain-containing protein n=1 Tax=Clitoria ternatea TaxID=43366 RepID=A0AAN9K4S9_CLITE